MDCSLPGSSIHGIFQARVLESVAIAFSKIYGVKSIIEKNVCIRKMNAVIRVTKILMT